MHDTYLITYKNNNKLCVSVANKCGSSSCISIMGFPFLGNFKYRKDTNQINRKNWKIVSLQKNTNNLSQYPIRVAIVRDPVERFISCYKDRVVQRNKDNVKDIVLDFSYFVNNIEVIRTKYRDICRHTEPQVKSYGLNPKIFTHIINTQNINDQFIPLIEEVSYTQNIPIVYHKNSFAVSKIIPTKEERQKIKKFYDIDYKFFGEFF